MAILKPFQALRPYPQFASGVATQPYDVVNRKEVAAEAKKNPLTFFQVTRSEFAFDESESAYSQKVYEQAKTNLQQLINNKILFQEASACFYIYALTMKGRTQIGLVGLSSVADYEENKIKKHELTRPDKEQDRINHIATTKAQTGNVFLAYKNVSAIDDLLHQWKDIHTAIYDITTSDDVRHAIWVIDEQKEITAIEYLFATKVPHTYIADGHHRAASAAKVFAQTKTEKAKHFLTTLFPANQLHIMDYNRLVKDLNGHSEEQFLKLVSQDFIVTKKNSPAIPTNAKEFGMYINGIWYTLMAKEHTYENKNTIEKLNVSILQTALLQPILNIDDPRTNQRIDFAGGIRGWQELVQRVDNKDCVVAFMIYPITMDELFAVADEEKIMPPKSTWFEPKLRDGLLTNLIGDYSF